MGVQMKQQLRHVQFKNFRQLAKPRGYGRFRQMDLRTRVTLDTDGAQEAAAGVGWTADFFGDTSSVLAVRTKEPKIAADTPMGNEFLFCARALSLEIPHALTTLTPTEKQEVLQVMSKNILQIKAGPDIVFEKQIGYLLAGDAAGIQSHDGSNGAGASVAQTGPVSPQREGDDLDDAFIIFPGAAVSATIHGVGQWTTTDDVIVQLTLHGWLALKGSVEAGVRVLSLMDAVENPHLLDGALKAA